MVGHRWIEIYQYVTSDPKSFRAIPATQTKDHAEEEAWSFEVGLIRKIF